MNIKKKTAFFGGLALFLLRCSISNLIAQESEIGSALSRDYDLTLKYRVGDKDFHHIRTTYLEMNDSGSVATTRIVDGHFSREVLRFEDNKRYDQFLWRHVTIGERKGKGQVSEFKILPYAQDFQYDFSDKDMTPGHFPVDVASIPKTMEGYQFFVNLIDAHTFDVICNFENYENNINRIGQTTELPGQDLEGFIDFPPLFTDTRFSQSPLFTTFQGITSYENKPCAILAFRCDDSRIQSVVNMMNMRMPSDGTSYYWGEILLSLESRKILESNLFEYVVSTTNTGANAPPVKNVIRREITMKKMDQEEFESTDLNSPE